MTGGYEIGDKITLYVADRTKWNRFLYWTIRRPIPSKRQTFKVTEVSDSSALINPAIMEDKE